jgi:hypothetical protein
MGSSVVAWHSQHAQCCERSSSIATLVLLALGAAPHRLAERGGRRDSVSGSDPRGDQSSTLFDLLTGTFGTLFVRTFGTQQRDRPCTTVAEVRAAPEYRV